MRTTRKPNARRRRLGSQVRQLREQVGLTLKEAAAALQLAESTISRIELGERGIRTPDLNALLDLYGVTDQAKRQGLARLALDANRRDWFSEYEDILGEAFRDYLSLETEATSIRYYHPQAIPGLLQIEDYGRAVAPDHVDNTDVIERILSIRMTRQAILQREQPPSLSVVLDEQAIRRPIGGRDVLRRQLDHLVAMARRPNIDVRVLPTDVETDLVITGGSFVILSFPESSAEAVFLEDLLGGAYVEADDASRTYGIAFDNLHAAALGPEASVKLIIAVAEELSADDRAKQAAR